MTEATSEPHAIDWPLRPWLLAGLFAAAGLAINLVTGGHAAVAWQMAVAAFLFFGAIAAGFTVERERWREPAVFAALIGAVMAGLAWRAVQYGDQLADEQYGFAAGAVASALALPLFQASFRHRRLATPYTEVFHHVWTDAIFAAGSLAFTGLSWLVLVVLSELFHLLKLDVLRELMNDGWFGWTYSGLAFGAALGTLRNQAKVIATLQTVVLLVASLLAVPLAAGLVVFLLASAVSGPQVLWEATRSATPVLLACAAGAFVLTSAILRQDDAAMTRNRTMRIAALVLAVVILPLAVFAAVSMGLRLNQYGLAPERLWGLVAIVVACAWGLGYWGALLRGRRTGWTTQLRHANFILALGACGLALLLALPILDFGRISAGNQLHRLESGQVSAAKFDFAALRWDFGESGRRALARLRRAGDAKVAELASSALAQKERTYATFDRTNRTRADFKLRVTPDDPELRQQVLDYLIANAFLCQDRCVALDVEAAPGGGRRIALVQSGSYELLVSKPGAALVRQLPADRPATALGADSVVAVGKTRAIMIDGKPIGQPLDLGSDLDGGEGPR
ncbi:MAG: DUF4153 domain-containing protein [Croceibacterium sp.]